MNPRDKLIVAVDVPELAKAALLTGQLGPHVGVFKVGLELLTSEGAPQVVRLIKECGGDRVFYDGKFKDIPNTVAGASRAVARLGVWAFNVHCLGGFEMMKAAREASEDEAGMRGITRPLVLGVTLLTSLDYPSLVRMGVAADVSPECYPHQGPEAIRFIVERLATLAKEAGLDGVIASPQEIKAIRDVCGPDFRIVTPGIRPAEAGMDDQKRTGTPKGAIEAGADFLVVGRPITGAVDPILAAQKICDEIYLGMRKNSIPPGQASPL